MSVRFGFDVSDRFQPVLGEIEPATAELLVEVGAAGLPVLAPMAIPSAGGGGAGGGFTLACVVGEYEQAFSEFGDATGIIDDGGGGVDGGCGQAGESCWPSTTTYHYGPNCSPWSGWSVQQSPSATAYCRRERDCRTHTRTMTIHSDCSVTWGPDTYGPWIKQYGTKPVNAQGFCDP